MVKKEGAKRLKTFNLNEELYNEYSEHCRKNGISMSKRVENFIKNEMEMMKGNVKFMDNKKGNIGGEIEHSFKRYC